MAMTGQYTLAMIAYDSGLFFWNWDVQVVGMDVDELQKLTKRKAGDAPLKVNGVEIVAETGDDVDDMVTKINAQTSTTKVMPMRKYAVPM